MQDREHALVLLARQAILYYLTSGEHLTTVAELSLEWQRPAGAFVSLKHHGLLRGCIGTCLPTQPTLAQEIMLNAVGAATADPRFPPVTLDDMADMDISVDVLALPEKVDSEVQLDPQRFGVIVRSGERRAVLLPGIPQVTTATVQVAITRRKAGIRPDEPVEIYRFEVTRYHSATRV
jgi:hypothetical protein